MALIVFLFGTGEEMKEAEYKLGATIVEGGLSEAIIERETPKDTIKDC